MTQMSQPTTDANTVDLRQRYIDLMKKTLSFSLWKNPGVPLEELNLRRRYPLPVRALINIASGAAHGLGLEISRRPVAESAKEEGRIWPVLADTMIGLKRLDNLQFCIETVIRAGVPGDLIETGVWRGGSCIFMRSILMAYGVTDRRVFVADSFRGLPKPDKEKFPQDSPDKLFTVSYLAVSRTDVERNFAKYGLLDKQVVFLEGWFKDTLPTAPIEKLSVMRLDGDMYQSTMDVLNNLYPKLSVGGFCIVDDYGLTGCRLAIDDFRRQHGINAPLQNVDWTGAFWRKEL
jgi:cephalosporin hydroxylase